MYIVGGRILTMAGREILEGILQIRNGKIAQVGARGEVKLQPEEGEQVVIAKNALIMPGTGYNCDRPLLYGYHGRKKEHGRG
mgnify:CR=1 FL=1